MSATLTPTPDPVLVRVDTAAAMLSVCPRTIYTLVARGELPLRHVGRAARIHVDDIHKFAAGLGGQPEAKT